MSLSSDLISQFVKATKPEKPKTTEATVYGTVKDQNGDLYVQLDGSDILTPISSTVKIEDGERVIVQIKDHTATVTGNLSTQSARSDDVEDNTRVITELGTVVAGKVSTEELEAETARIEKLIAGKVSVEELEAETARIEELIAGNVTAEELEAELAEINKLIAGKVDADFVEATYATIEDLNATNAEIYNLSVTHGEFENLTAEHFTAVEANIEKLTANKADIEHLHAEYANIDFANITELAVENLIAMTGYIDSIVGSDGTFTDTLVGVTIKGDLIEAGTLVADKLVVLGEDGLYYRLNLDGSSVEAEQTEYNSLNGSVITAKSITATKIAVDDLVAFDATIGGFNITEKSIYSEVKDSEENTTRGIYFDTDGQVNIGDANNFIKYLQNEDGTYSLAISAENIMYALNGTQRNITDLAALTEYVAIGTYEGEPCILLGEHDSDFRLVITNTRILFQEGTDTPAWITNQSLHIKKAVVEEEMAFGQFVWQTRANGNMGLIWKDEIVEEIAEEVGE